MSPKVSVVTVCYNSVNTLEATILSVFNQTYPNIEYIVIDGGSTDGTLEIINKYQDRIAFFISEKDEGIAEAFNKGLAVTTGEIVGILNSDDHYSPTTVAKIVTTLQDHPEYGFVFGDIHFINFSGKPLFIQKGDPHYFSKIVGDMPSIPHPTVFVRKLVYQEYGGFDQHYHTAMDYEFLLRISKQGVRGYYISEVLGYMRLGGESDTNCIRGYREVYQISLRYGYNRVLAFCRFKFKCIRTLTRRVIERLGFERLVKWYRTRIIKRCEYEERGETNDIGGQRAEDKNINIDSSV